MNYSMVRVVIDRNLGEQWRVRIGIGVSCLIKVGEKEKIVGRLEDSLLMPNFKLTLELIN